MKTYTLIFDGPFSFTIEHERCLLRDPKAKLCGIYIHAVPFSKGGYLPTYVGQTGRSFGQRTIAHIIHLIGGYDRIYNPDTLVNGIEEVLWKGLWGKGAKGRIEEYPIQLPKLIYAIQGMLSKTVIFIAEIDSDNRTRESIESTIAFHIRSQSGPVTSLLRDDIRYRPTKEQEDDFLVNISCKEHIVGLPKTLRAL